MSSRSSLKQGQFAADTISNARKHIICVEYVEASCGQSSRLLPWCKREDDFVNACYCRINNLLLKLVQCRQCAHATANIITNAWYEISHGRVKQPVSGVSPYFKCSVAFCQLENKW